jgi:hypothetical protein
MSQLNRKGNKCSQKSESYLPFLIGGGNFGRRNLKKATIDRQLNEEIIPTGPGRQRLRENASESLGPNIMAIDMYIRWKIHLNIGPSQQRSKPMHMRR